MRYLEAVDGLRLVDLRVEDIVVEMRMELTGGESEVELVKMFEEKSAVRRWGVEIFRCWCRCDGVVWWCWWCWWWS